MIPTLAERMTDYAQALRFEDLPAEVVHEAKRVVIDSLGCALGAYNEEPVVVGRKVAMDLSAKRCGATIIGTRHVAPADWAAFVNGCMVRYFDYNDTYLSKEPAHPSDNIPACLVAGEASGADGRALITAIVIAYEVQCRLADTQSIRARGWDHVTYGAFSTALGAAKLFKLDPAKMKHALGIAGVNSAALRQSRVGELSHWKGCAFANAARHGVYSAMLAREGMTGPAPIFEGEKGFEKLVSGPLTEIKGPFGIEGSHAQDGYMILKSCIKHVPAEYHAQSAIAAALQIRKELGITPKSEIESIVVDSHDASVDIIGSEPEKWKPTARETADHSLPYMTAAALMDGEITDRQFEPRRFTDPHLLSWVALTKIRRHKELSDMYPEAVGNIVTVTLKDARNMTVRMDYPPGHCENRLPDDQLLGKYHTLADPIIGEKNAKSAADWVWKLDSVKELKELFPLVEVKTG